MHVSKKACSCPEVAEGSARGVLPRGHEDLGIRWEQKLVNTHGLWKKVDINLGDAECRQPSVDTQTTPPAPPVLPSVQTKP